MRLFYHSTVQRKLAKIQQSHAKKIHSLLHYCAVIQNMAQMDLLRIKRRTRILPEKKKMRVYVQSHMEIVLRALQFFEQDKRQRRRIKLNNFLERTAGATRVNRNIISKIALSKIFKLENKPGVPIATRKEPVIPKNFSIVVRLVVREINLERKQLTTLDLI